MEVRDSEKLILTMLCELYRHLKVEGDTDPDFIQSAILSGNSWGISWKYPGLFLEEGALPTNVEETLKILEMWEMIEIRYNQLSQDQKEAVADQCGGFGKDPKFKGFYGNTESEYIGIVKFLTNDLDRYKMFKGRELNSHMPLLEAYQRMLSTYLPRRDDFINNAVSVDSLIEIINKQVHPDNR